MKKAPFYLLCLCLLTGCSGQPKELDQAAQLRSSILQASEISFAAEIRADYGDQTHSFSMDCRSDPKGTVHFHVTEPDSISGISGQLSGESGQLVFSDTALAFPLLADEQLTPISAPWILMQTLRSGYITSACTEEGQIHLTASETYEEDALQLDIWLNTQLLPVQADILYDGVRILSVSVKDFAIA